ncbi:hypothetical protein [Dictyobacter aurantiacus]|uniref:Uncharacterized protein n=1 Tax=Dictyobacter aurantiacus TaxID=1936993 RepID=A0A401ZJW8_9CHLR|nr:hypothetical protein [Dictyobacter aurantiacus]GCE07157.1 hypothetical protein KDAU_44860 [Dictyobacter aurantiacus]
MARSAAGKLVLLDNSGQAYVLRTFDLQSGKLLSQDPVSLPFEEGPGESVLSNSRLYVKTGAHQGGQYGSGSSNTSRTRTSTPLTSQAARRRGTTRSVSCSNTRTPSRLLCWLPGYVSI